MYKTENKTSARIVGPAIETHFLGLTNHRGPRIVANSPAGRVVVDYEYGLSTPQNHARAAQRLSEKLGWCREEYEWVGGGTKKGYAFVQVPVRG